MHGETFGEWSEQVFASDPMAKPVVSPNDTMVDAASQEVMAAVMKSINERKTYKLAICVVPSPSMTLFMQRRMPGGPATTQDVVSRFAEKLGTHLASLADFTLVPPPLPGTAEATQVHRLVYNIQYCDLRPIRITEPPDRHHREEWYHFEYDGEMQANISLFSPANELKFSYDARSTIFRKENLWHAWRSLVDDTAKLLVNQYSRQFAPPACTTEMRGNGLFIRMNMGTAYGARPGMNVVFFRKLPVKAADGTVTGYQDQTIGTGHVMASGLATDSAWLKIHLHHYRTVHVGAFVRFE